MTTICLAAAESGPCKTDPAQQLLSAFPVLEPDGKPAAQIIHRAPAGKAAR